MFAVGDTVVAILERKAFLAKIEAIEERNRQIGYRVHFNGYDRSYNQWYSIDEENKELYPATPLYMELLIIHNGKSSPRPITAQRVPIENPNETPVPKPIHTKNRTRIARDKDGKPVVKKDNEVTDVNAKNTKNEDPYFIVEKICSHRRRSNNLQFQVKWKGYSATDNTWESLDNLREARIYVYDYIERSDLDVLLREVKKYYDEE